MGIREIKTQLKKYNRLTLSELAIVLKAPENSFKHILDEWIEKGKIKIEKEVPICMSCGCKCSSGTANSCSAVKIYYSWIGSKENIE